VFFAIIVITATSETSFSQCYFDVEFNLIHSRRIPYQNVTINMTQNCMTDSAIVKLVSNPSDLNSIKWEYSKIDTTFKISRSEFEKIIKSVKQIKLIDIKYNPNIVSFGADGTTCIIGYGNNSDHVRFSKWSPDYNTESRGLQEFLNSCILILKMVNLDPKEIL